MGAVSAQGAPVAAAHRRRINAAVIGAMAFVVVAVPVAAYALTSHHHNGTATTASEVSASPVPSESPSATPSGPAPTLAPITQQEFANATLHMPTWAQGACPSGAVRLP